MDVAVYTSSQSREIEQRLTTVEARAVIPLWKWRFERASGPSPCFVFAEAPGGPRGWVSAVRTELMISGRPVPAAQVIGGDLSRLSGDETFDRSLYDALFAALTTGGIEVVYGSVDPEVERHARALGFFPLTDVAVRSLYLGLGISRRMGGRDSFNPLRAIAREAARIRTKLVEAPVDAENIKRFAHAHALRTHEYSLTVHKDEAYLRWRYLEDPRGPNRFFVHRRRAGAGLDGFVALRLEENERGRVEAQILDHHTREPGRRAHAVLLGEVALWAMTEGAEVLRGFAVAGSNVEQALIGMGGVRKKAERSLVLKRISDRAPAPESLDPRKVALRAGDLELAHHDLP